VSVLRIGIVGDGQLGMMLCDAARDLGLETAMLASDAAGPAALRANRVIEGAMDDPVALSALVEAVDVITYEREDLPPEAVRALRAAEERGQVRCFPPLHCVEMIQDKILQKRWYAEHGLATLPFHVVDGSAAALERAADALGYPLVQKAPRGGFDGRGVQLLRTPEDLSSHAWPGETLIEQFAGDFREIAVLVVRTADGDTDHFGPVDMSFEAAHSVLDTVRAPADISETVRARAVDLAHRAVAAMAGVGVFGVELFLLASDEVLINEISPRVHNAGHYSLEACASTQFEQHLRAVAGLPLGPCTLERPAAMKNILCTPALKTQNRAQSARVDHPEGPVREHWYGKSPARLMRKLGHITATADNAPAALALVEDRWKHIQDMAAEEGNNA